MLSISQTKIIAGGVILLGAFALEGCTRHGAEPTVTYGSIKDDAPGAAPVHRTSARGASASQSGQRSASAGPPAPAGSADNSARPAMASAGAGASENAAAAAAGSAAPVSSPAEPATAPPKQAGADRVAAARPATEAQPTTTERLLIQGRQLFQAGKVQEARKRFIAALNGLSPEATLELARTFDTHYLSKLGLADGAPDMQRALQLYKSAVERGSEAAKADLARVEATLNTSK